MHAHVCEGVNLCVCTCVCVWVWVWVCVGGCGRVCFLLLLFVTASQSRRSGHDAHGSGGNSAAVRHPVVRGAKPFILGHPNCPPPRTPPGSHRPWGWPVQCGRVGHLGPAPGTATRTHGALWRPGHGPSGAQRRSCVVPTPSPGSVVTPFRDFATSVALGPDKGPAGLAAACLLDAQAPPKWPINWIHRLKYYALQPGDPHPNPAVW